MEHEVEHRAEWTGPRAVGPGPRRLLLPRRHAPHHLLGLLLLAGTVGCATEPPASAGGERDTLRILIEAEIQDLDPRLAQSAYSVKAAHLVHAGLVSLENETSEPRLELAESYTHPDALTYEFTLRPGLRFHDGSPLTAADVVWTYRSLSDPAVGSPYAGLFDELVEVTALDVRRVRFVLGQPHAPFLADLTMGIVPERATRPHGGRFVGPVIGAGPYRVVRFSPDRLELERAETWTLGPRPALRKLVLRTLRDDNARLLALLGGAGDLVQNGVNPLLLPVVERDPRLVVRHGPSIAYNYLGLNLQDPLLSRRRVRQAIAQAIDVPAILTARFHGTARPATSLLPPGHWAHRANLPGYPHDPAAARALLDAEGLRDPDGPAGPRPRFSLVFKTTTNRFRRSLARVIAQQLGEVGIAVEVRSFEWGTFFHDVRTGNFQLYSLQWPAVVDPDLYRWIFHSSMVPGPANGNSGANRGRYRDPIADALIEAGRREQDRDRRREIYGRLQELLAEELPYISLWHEDNVAVLAAELEGYTILPNAHFNGVLGARWR